MAGNGRILIDFAGCDAMLKNLKAKSVQVKESAESAAKAADPSGIYEGAGANAYKAALANYTTKQTQLDQALDALTGLLEKFSNAVHQGDMEAASHILDMG